VVPPQVFTHRRKSAASAALSEEPTSRLSQIAQIRLLVGMFI
jgi:hypothetical protein